MNSIMHKIPYSTFGRGDSRIVRIITCGNENAVFSEVWATPKWSICKWNIAVQYEIILTDYEFFCTSRKWNKIRSFICRRHISHLRSKYFISKIFHSIRKERISLKKTIALAIVFFLAQTVRFELTCGCPQTDFESAPLWPLRYVCILQMTAVKMLNYYTLNLGVCQSLFALFHL